MDALLIEGPSRLKGSVAVSGSKNSALPLLFASLLCDKPVHYENIPRLWDIETTLHLLDYMGVESSWDKEAGTVSILPTVKRRRAPYEWVSQMRAGILALGPLVAKYGDACVSLPGGCAIGARPVNLHIEMLRHMGVEIDVAGGYILARVPKRVVGARLVFPQVTVTGTENILVVAARAEGTTEIHNAACEPEVVVLGEVLKSWGAQISGLGTPTITVTGSELVPTTQPVRVPPDRIETGTWLAAAAATGSEIEITHCDTSQMASVLCAFRDMGVGIEISGDEKTVRVHPAGRLLPLRIETSPYPGFPTDMQAQIVVAMCLASGNSEIRETIFENRFMHIAELRRLGAKIEVDGNLARICGPSRLTGAPLMATDLRASASLVVAALCAEGETEISRIYHLDRGYQRLDQKLSALGVKVRRIST